MAIKAIVNTNSAEENKKVRHRIEHCALPSEEQLKQLSDHGIIAGSSYLSLGDSYLANLGKERAERVFPHASFKQYGITAPGNSDLPVCNGNPLFGIYSAVTRKTVGGQQFGTKEAISVEDAVKAYTTDAAYSGFDEDKIGSLSIGKYADLIILDQDPFIIAPEAIKNIEVIQTFVDGKTVYEKRGG